MGGEELSTNYYMMITNKELVKKYFPNEYQLVDDPYLGYQIHIGKRSMGWLPLFESHKQAYDSVEDMIKFVFDYKPNAVRVFDEYGRRLSTDQLIEELVKWGEYQTVRYMKYIPGGRVWNQKYGWKEYFEESTKDDYDITYPYDHLEYSKFDTGEMWELPTYYRDKDGYNFVEGQFY